MSLHSDDAKTTAYNPSPTNEIAPGVRLSRCLSSSTVTLMSKGVGWGGKWNRLSSQVCLLRVGAQRLSRLQQTSLAVCLVCLPPLWCKLPDWAEDSAKIHWHSGCAETVRKARAYSWGEARNAWFHNRVASACKCDRFVVPPLSWYAHTGTSAIGRRCLYVKPLLVPPTLANYWCRV